MVKVERQMTGYVKIFVTHILVRNNISSKIHLQMNKKNIKYKNGQKI